MCDIVGKAIQVLNGALEADRDAVTEIFENRVSTKFDLWDDAEDDIVLGAAETIGALGLINGICDAQLVAQYDSSGKIVQFLRLKDCHPVCVLTCSVEKERAKDQG